MVQSCPSSAGVARGAGGIWESRWGAGCFARRFASFLSAMVFSEHASLIALVKSPSSSWHLNANFLSVIGLLKQQTCSVIGRVSSWITTLQSWLLSLLGKFLSCFANFGHTDYSTSNSSDSSWTIFCFNSLAIFILVAVSWMWLSTKYTWRNLGGSFRSGIRLPLRLHSWSCTQNDGFHPRQLLLCNQNLKCDIHRVVIPGNLYFG